jgi:hypothetical protein
MLVISRNESLQSEENTLNMLSSRMNHPQRKFNGCIARVSVEGDQINNPDASLVKSVKMEYIKRLPPFTFWTNLTRYIWCQMLSINLCELFLMYLLILKTISCKTEMN